MEDCLQPDQNVGLVHESIWGVVSKLQNRRYGTLLEVVILANRRSKNWRKLNMNFTKIAYRVALISVKKKQPQLLTYYKRSEGVLLWRKRFYLAGRPMITSPVLSSRQGKGDANEDDFTPSSILIDCRPGVMSYAMQSHPLSQDSHKLFGKSWRKRGSSGSLGGTYKGGA